MKAECTLIVILFLAGGCSGDGSHHGVSDVADSATVLPTHEALEEAIRKYYRSIEEEVKMDLGVSEAAVTERVQLLIDEGYVKKPVILIVTEEGPRWHTVDYATYKELMTDHAIASRKLQGTRPNIRDSVTIDSIRSRLLEALKGHRVN